MRQASGPVISHCFTCASLCPSPTAVPLAKKLFHIHQEEIYNSHEIQGASIVINLKAFRPYVVCIYICLLLVLISASNRSYYLSHFESSNARKLIVVSLLSTIKIMSKTRWFCFWVWVFRIFFPILGISKIPTHRNVKYL